MTCVRLLALGSLLAASAGVSCRSAGPSALSYSVERVTQQPSLVLDTAEIVLAERGYAIARRDAQEGVVVSRPQPLPNESGRRERAARRVAEVRIEPASDGTSVFCKVSLQRQATQAYQMFQVSQAGDDTPGSDTAIDRDPGGTAAQNTVWRTVSRDKLAEREILDAIAARVGNVPR